MLGYQGKLRDLVQTAMQTVGLDFEEFVDRPLYSLSGGQKRRVALASYLVIQPDMLLLDEPFAGLDPATHQEMLDFVRALNHQGKTVLISTHNMRDLLALTQRALVLHQGKLVFDGSVPDLFEQKELQNWGMDIPLEIQVADVLRQRGWQIPRNAITWQEIIAWLRKSSQEGAHAVL
jgi:energy-coupling factor transport system ATP-binding protein